MLETRNAPPTPEDDLSTCSRRGGPGRTGGYSFMKALRSGVEIERSR